MSANQGINSPTWLAYLDGDNDMLDVSLDPNPLGPFI